MARLWDYKLSGYSQSVIDMQIFAFGANRPLGVTILHEVSTCVFRDVNRFEKLRLNEGQTGCCSA